MDTSSIPKFEFATATRIVFGAHTLPMAVEAALSWGQRLVLVTGQNPDRLTALHELLAAAKIEPLALTVAGEPTTVWMAAALAQARAFGAEVVVGVGGGSALDAGKALAALLPNPGEPLDYLEVIGRGHSLTHSPLPYVAVPTTAGTGSEVTRNAVLASPAHQLKVSLRSPRMLPRLAVVDPTLTYTLPPAATASTGLDALTQLIEPFTSHAANPMTDALCREGIQRAGRSLQRAYAVGTDANARADMALASLFSGLALANAKLGAVHGLAAPIGGLFPAPHGAVCARLLPIVTEANIRALQARAPQSPALARYAEVAQLLTDRLHATLADGIAWLHTTCAALAIPPLSQFGLTPAAFPSLIAQAQKASSMAGNPISLTDEELTVILMAAL